MAKVSVIVPVYNTEQYIEKCLESLVNQTLDDIEIVLINDGSTDESLSIMTKYKEKYADKILLISQENAGQGVARNLGISKCSGEYIGFVDSDDYVNLSMYETMWEKANEENLDLVECRYQYIDEKNKELKQYGDVRPYRDCNDMFIDPLVSPWNKLVKADILKRINSVFAEGVIYEDTAFFLKIIPHIKKSGFVDQALVYHINRGTSTMNANKNKRVGDIFKVLKGIIDYYDKNNYRETYKNELEYFCVKILLCSSMVRISKVTDKKLCQIFLNTTFEMINDYFPEYKGNPYMQQGKKNLYMKLISYKSAKVLLPLFRRIGE